MSILKQNKRDDCMRYLNIKVVDTNVDDNVPTKEVTDSLNQNIANIVNTINNDDRNLQIGDVLQTINSLSTDSNWLKISGSDAISSVSASEYPELSSIITPVNTVINLPKYTDISIPAKVNVYIKAK